MNKYINKNGIRLYNDVVLLKDPNLTFPPRCLVLQTRSVQKSEAVDFNMRNTKIRNLTAINVNRIRCCQQTKFLACYILLNDNRRKHVFNKNDMSRVQYVTSNCICCIWYGMIYIYDTMYDMIHDTMYDMIYDTIWYMIYDMIYDIMYGMIRYDIWYDTIYDMIWCMIWYGMIYDIRYDTLWYMIWCMIYDTIWYMIWCIWYDTIWYMIHDMIYDIWYDIFINCNWVDTRWQ